MSMFADYFKEFCGDCTIEDAGGFVVYRYLNERQVYIVHIYVVPKCRKSGVASALADKVVKEAKEFGCSELLGSVVTTAVYRTESIKVLLGYGMSFHGIEGNMLIFRKDI